MHNEQGSCSVQETVPAPGAEQRHQQVHSLCAALLGGGVTHYTPRSVLGSGTCGVVLRASDTRCTPPVEVAVKLMPRGNFVRDYRTYLMREIVHTASLKHPSIIPLREAFLTPSHLGIAMEYARGGDMHRYLNTRRGCRLPEGEARWLFQQMAIGLQYCHLCGVANRDLKLENLLLDDASEARPLLKICDFGFSKHENNSSAKSGVGTTAYWAPEVLLGSFSYNAKAVDLWAAGVILYTMLYGTYPFDPSSPHFPRQVVVAQYTPPPGIEVSSSCQHLLTQLLHPDPQRRATMDEVCRHPWFLTDLPAGAVDMNAVLTRHAARRAAAEVERGLEMAVAVHRLVERAAEMGAEGDPVVCIPL